MPRAPRRFARPGVVSRPARLLEAWPDPWQDSRRDMLRLHLLDAADPGVREADGQRHGEGRSVLSRLSYAVQRAVAEGAAPETAPFEALLATRLREALAGPPGDAAAPLALLLKAGSVALGGNGPSLSGSGAAGPIETHDTTSRGPRLTARRAEAANAARRLSGVAKPPEAAPGD